MEPKQIWDLKASDPVLSTRWGPALFVGFMDEGLECQILLLKSFKTVPTSDLVLSENAQEALEQILSSVSRQPE
jgi:hypothetical protein